MSNKNDSIKKYESQLSKLGQSIDQPLLEKITNELGSANHNSDAQYVSASDDKEVTYVYTNFVKKKLNIKDKDKGMKMINEVLDSMSGINKKYRAVVYYLLHQKAAEKNSSQTSDSMNTNESTANLAKASLFLSVAAILLALAALFGGQSNSIIEGNNVQVTNTPEVANEKFMVEQYEPQGPDASDFRGFDPVNDHYFGNPNASITIVEYSDFECPFCTRVHETLKRVIADNDDVVWVYRHLPLGFHPNARPAAIASECIAQYAGNEAFQEFSDNLFADSKGRLNSEYYMQFAQTKGIDSNTFTQCLNNTDVANAVQQDALEANALGGSGTPFNVIVTPDNKLIPIEGAYPYEYFTEVINSL